MNTSHQLPELRNDHCGSRRSPGPESLIDVSSVNPNRAVKLGQGASGEDLSAEHMERVGLLLRLFKDGLTPQRAADPR
jgi:hypothetical protein